MSRFTPMLRRTLVTAASSRSSQQCTALPKSSAFQLQRPSGQLTTPLAIQCRTATTSESGAFLADPERISFGLPGVFLTVTIGLLIGAAVSKNIASFLEENELFVPSDDDDDD